MMRIFVNCVEMFNEVKRDLYEMGTRYQTETVQDQQVKDDPKFQTIELFAYDYQLHDVTPDGLISLLDLAKVNKVWALCEVRDRLGSKLLDWTPDSIGVLNPGNAWRIRRAFWERFLRDDVFSYSYAERWWEQIPYVIRELRRRPNTRQATITMYDRHQDMMNWGGRDRVPCSLTYQFLIRDGALHVIYNQRSCDFVNFFAADVFFTWHLLAAIAGAIEVKVGTLTHFIGSLHAFAGDLAEQNVNIF